MSKELTEHQKDCITVALDLVKKGGPGTEVTINSRVFGFGILVRNEKGIIKVSI